MNKKHLKKIIKEEIKKVFKKKNLKENYASIESLGGMWAKIIERYKYINQKEPDINHLLKNLNPRLDPAELKKAQEEYQKSDIKGIVWLRYVLADRFSMGPLRPNDATKWENSTNIRFESFEPTGDSFKIWVIDGNHRVPISAENFGYAFL